MNRRTTLQFMALRVALAQWKSYLECCAGASLAACDNARTVRLSNSFCDCESESSAVLLATRRINSKEAIEYLRQKRIRNSPSIVGDSQQRRRSSAFQHHFDASSIRRVLDCIVEQDPD